MADDRYIPKGWKPPSFGEYLLKIVVPITGAGIILAFALMGFFAYFGFANNICVS